MVESATITEQCTSDRVSCGADTLKPPRPLPSPGAAGVGPIAALGVSPRSAGPACMFASNHAIPDAWNGGAANSHSRSPFLRSLFSSDLSFVFIFLRTLSPHRLQRVIHSLLAAMQP